MSITLINPSGEQSIQDNLWHIASSSNSGVTDMKYVFDIYYKGQQLVRTKIFPEPITGKGFFDASPIIKNEITYDWFNPSTGSNICVTQPSTSGQIAATYQVFVGEDVSGVTTLNMASGQVTAYNYAPPTFKRKQFDLTDYNNRFLTNRPLHTYRGSLTDRIYAGVRSLVNGREFQVRGYNENGFMLWGENYLYYQIPTGNQFLQLDIGAQNINDVLYSYQITNDLYYYEVGFVNTITEFARVYLDCNPKYQPISLHFINAFGMFDTARFSLVSKWTTETERKTFEKRDYSFGASSVDYYDTNNVYKESKINYGSKTNSSYRFTMNFPTDEEYQWLSELIVSPQVYMELDEAFYPVSIKANNYEYSKNINNGLRAFEIDVDVNQKRFNFRR
jgi:hypothetical protein